MSSIPAIGPSFAAPALPAASCAWAGAAKAPRRVVRCLTGLVAALALGATVVSAQTNISWNLSGGGNWKTSGNWSGGVPNTSSEVAIFNNSGGGTINYNISGTTSLGGITFNSNAGAYTISRTGSAYTLNIGAYGINQNDNTAQVITGSGIRLSLGAATSFNVNSSGALTISTTGGSIATTATNKLTLGGNGSGLGTISSQISGAGLLTKSGTGTWVLSSSSNNYTGGTTIADGTLVANANNALGTSGTIKFTGGTLRYGTGITTDYSSRIATSTGAIDIDTNGNNVTFASALANTNSGGLIKSGTGTLTLSGNNAYTGGTTLDAGTLALGHNSALSTGTLTINGGTVSASGGTRTISNAVVTNGDFTIGGSQALEFSGAINLGGGTRTITVDNTATTTFSGVVGEPWYSSLVKAGDGRLVLSGANTFSGTVTVDNGTLALTHSNALGTTGQWNAITSGATLELSNNISVNEGGFDVAGTGHSGAGAVHNLSGNNTLTGQLQMTGDTTLKASAGSLTLASAVNTQGYALTVDGAGDMTFNGAINGPGGSLTKAGGGTLTLSAANNHQAGTTLGGGTIVANHANALAYGGDISFTGGTLRYGTGITTDWSSRIANSSAAIAIDTNGNNVTFASALANTNTGGLTKSGTGTLSLTSANSYSGATTVDGGALNLQHNSALGNSTAVTVNSGATLQLQGGRTITGVSATLAGGTLESVSGTNQWAGNITLTAPSTLTSSTAGQTFTVGNNSFTNTIAMGANTLTVGGAGDMVINSFVGQSGDTGSFVKNGSGTVTFYGDRNYYTGATTVNDGKLYLDTLDGPVDQTILGNLNIGDGTGAAESAIVQYSSASNSHNKIVNTSTVTINTDGLLDLNGRRDTIGALVMTGGRVDSRNSPGIQGTLSINGDITINASTTGSVIDGYQFSLNDTLDSTSVRNVTVANGSAASDLTINAEVTNGGINKLGQGTMTLTRSNSYGGTTTVTGGILNIRNGASLGANGGGDAANGTTVASGAALEIQNNITVGAERLTLSGDGYGGSGGALRNVSGSNTWNGAVVLADNARITTDASSTLTLNGTITSSTDKNVIFDSAGTTYATNSIGTGNGGVTKQSDGTLYLSGNSTYHGATTVSAGVVNISHDNALGATDGGTTVASGAALELQGNIHVGTEALSLSGSGISSGGALRNVSGNNQFDGTVTVSSATALIRTDAGSLTLGSAGVGGVAVGGNALTIGGAANTEIAGVLTGSSTGSLTKADASTLTISGANNNSFASNVNINSGTLLMAANNALNNAAVDVAVNGGTFSLQTYAQTIGSLTGTGTVDFGAGDGITTFSSLTLLADSTFSGTFTGTGKIIVGAGVTLTLGNDFNAAGVTIVLAGGTLNVNGSDSTFAGLTLTGNSTIDFDSADDSIIHFTNLSLGSYSLAVSGWADEQDYFLVNNDPGNKATAPLNQVSFANSGPWVGNDTIWTGDYSGYPYNNEVRPWKPVPEPSTYGAMLLGAGLAFFGYRRWRQQRAAKK